MNRTQPRHPTRGGQLLLRWLALHDLTQSAFSDIAALPQCSVNRYCRGTAVPSIFARGVIESITKISEASWDKEPK
jgi:hypothetical protein